MHRHMKKAVFIAIAISLLLLFFSPYTHGNTGKVYLITIDGAISPANADYFVRGLDAAVANDSDIAILKLDTPGGLDKSMRFMIQAILASPIPVVVYIAPKGARGASAGTYIVYASHIAAMAPATNIGSATPITIGLTEPSKKRDKRNDELDEEDSINDFFEADESQPSDNLDGNILQAKMINDAQAYIQSLAELRGRNQEWAIQSVSQAENISANKALELKVIDLIAYDLKTLINLLHGRKVNLGDKQVVLELIEPEIVEFEPDWRTEVLIIITDPSIAYLLLLAGVYGLMFEFLNPGSLLPGTIGAVCLVIALYAFNTLPINMAGLILLVIGIALMTAEIFAPSFGILGLGGISAFAIGSFMLMDSSLPGYQIAPALIISSVLVSSFVFFVIFSMVFKSRNKPIVSGGHELINHLAVSEEDFEHSGRVRIRGEIWLADSDTAIKKRQRVRVEAINGLRLKVTAED
jgi:membrane-bound serine protease (ClpP class)